MRQLLPLAALLAVASAPAIAQDAQGGARDNIDVLIAEHARANKVPAAFVHRVVKRESNYNAKARGGSALGLMQIKHATAKGLGYSGDASGLYDPDTNLKYGIAYLAGAYRAAKGDLEQAYRYYNRGYYYVAKRLGIEAEVPEEPSATAAVAQSSAGFSGPFGPRPAPATPAAGTVALAYAAAPAAATGAVEVPLPPRRPADLSGAFVPVAAAPGAAMPVSAPVLVAGAVPAPTLAPQQAALPGAAQQGAVAAVDVPLPPRRPTDSMLAAIARPIVLARKPTAPAPVMEASALAVDAR